MARTQINISLDDETAETLRALADLRAARTGEKPSLAGTAAKLLAEAMAGRDQQPDFAGTLDAIERRLAGLEARPAPVPETRAVPTQALHQAILAVQHRLQHQEESLNLCAGLSTPMLEIQTQLFNQDYEWQTRQATLSAELATSRERVRALERERDQLAADKRAAAGREAGLLAAAAATESQRQEMRLWRKVGAGLCVVVLITVVIAGFKAKQTAGIASDMADSFDHLQEAIHDALDKLPARPAPPPKH